MTKQDLIEEVAKCSEVNQIDVRHVIETTMEVIKDSMSKNHNIYLRGFGAFLVKKRADKTARNISKGTSIHIPAHYIPAFKPCPEFLKKVKENVK